MSFAQALFERIVQFIAGQAFLAQVEIMAHHGFVDLDDLVDDALVRLGHGREVGNAFGLEKGGQGKGKGNVRRIPNVFRSMPEGAIRPDGVRELYLLDARSLKLCE